MKALKFRIKHHVTRKLRLSNSRPYLSSDLYLKECEYAVPEKLSTINEDRALRAKTLFVPSHHLTTIFNKYGDQLNARIVFCGNSDYEFKVEIFNIPKKVERLYLQNSYISDNSRIFTLPIGIENLRLARNGFKSSMKRDSKEGISQESTIMVGPFGPTHEKRKEIYESFRNSDCWKVFNFPISPDEFQRLHRHFRFTMCPRGNGVDTHRVWESIYRGSWPIVEKDSWSLSLKDLFPLVIVDSLLDKEALIQLTKDTQYLKPPVAPAELYWNYWLQLIREFKS